MRLYLQLLLSSFILFSLNVFAQDPFGDGEDEFLPVEKAYQVNVSIENDSISMNWNIAEGYYLYQHQFKALARNSEEAESLALEYQPGKRKFDEYFGKELETYYHETELKAALPTQTPPYELVITSQGCADAGLCYPPRKQYFSVEADGIVLALNEPQFSTTASSNANPIEIEKQDDATNVSLPEENHNIFLILLSAIFGGLILNLMPCVFPVLSLKALSLANSSAANHEQHLHGWAYTAGVVGSFLVAGTAILVAREAGGMLGWGFQLQQPIFVAFMAYLFFIMGLTLSGMFTMGSSLMGAGQELTAGNGLKSSFFTGVLAALVASPCTAPFMATALGVALTKPIPVALLIFASLGLGMALPFILLSYIPKLGEYLPSPGPWMETLKEFLAFPLYATCVWLLWVFGNQSSSDGAALLALGGVFIVFGIWLNQQTPKKPAAKLATKAFAAAALVLSIIFAFKASEQKSPNATVSLDWETYSPSLLAEYRQSNTPVFVDLTADWCITCKVNERVALSSDAFFELSDKLGIVLMKGDWTNNDPEISKLLKKYNRSGVPLYLVYPNNSTDEPQVLPQILSPALVKEALNKAVAAKVASN